MNCLVEICNATIATPGRRILFDGLNLRLGSDRVALMGRNGVGKSTLLAVLAGEADVERGQLRANGRPCYVRQSLDARAVRTAFDRAYAASPTEIAGDWLSTGSAPIVEILRSPTLSRGELRKLALLLAKRSEADILLLDEPTEDVDDMGIAWLRTWLRRWPGCLICASHDPRLLDDFEHFFIASETGCRVVSGKLGEVDAELLREHDRAEERYAHNLNRLVAYEKHVLSVTRRRARKKRYGRCRELDRATPRIRLNQKRDYAQVKHGRMAALREKRLDELRTWSQSTRRALTVTLPLALAVHELPAEPRDDLLVLRNVSAKSGSRLLFAPIDVCIGRQRVGVVGANGTGKTTLLQIMLGRRRPGTGSVVRASRVGSIEQGGTDWMLDESLMDRLGIHCQGGSAASAADLLVVHKFPLALGKRSLASLSPGERVRAALISLFRQSPPVELLVLDEPTYSLDRVGWHAMIGALRAFRGGLVVASHDRAFLDAVGIETYIELGGEPSPKL